MSAAICNKKNRDQTQIEPDVASQSLSGAACSFQDELEFSSLTFGTTATLTGAVLFSGYSPSFNTLHYPGSAIGACQAKPCRKSNSVRLRRLPPDQNILKMQIKLSICWRDWLIDAPVYSLIQGLVILTENHSCMLYHFFFGSLFCLFHVMRCSEIWKEWHSMWSSWKVPSGLHERDFPKKYWTSVYWYYWSIDTIDTPWL